MIGRLEHRTQLVAVVLVLLVAAAATTTWQLLVPKARAQPRKIDGTLVSLGDPFTVNLAAGHYGRISVSLLVSGTIPAAAGSASPTLPENDAIRAIVTNDLTGIDSERLIDRVARHALLGRLLRDIETTTDEPVRKVLFTDIAVQ